MLLVDLFVGLLYHRIGQYMIIAKVLITDENNKNSNKRSLLRVHIDRLVNR
jgi:hypothetical protein